MSIRQRKEVKKKSYQADFYIKVNGRKRRIRKCGFDSKEDAKRYEREVVTQSETGKWNSGNKSGATFFELAKIYSEGYCRNKKSWKSDLSRLKKLVEYFGDYYLSELTKLHVSDYIKCRKGENTIRHKPVSGTTINRELELLRSMMNLAVEWELPGLVLNKINKLKNYWFKEEDMTNIISSNSLNKLVKMAPPYLKLMILIAINTGMRRGEILNLEWSRVNFNTNEIHIDKTKSMSLSERDVTMNNTIKRILFSLSKKMKGHRYVIENPKTGKCYVEIKKSWKTLVDKVGLKNFRFHDLRHNFATYTLYKNGGDLVTLKEILGHSTIAMTARYAHALGKGKKRLVNSFQIGSNLKLEELEDKK